MSVSDSPIRRLSPEGITEFRSLLQRAREGKNADFSVLANSDEAAPVIDASLRISTKPESSKFAVAQYLLRLLDGIDASGELSRDVGLWSWISLHWIDSLAPVQPDGRRPVKSDYRWIPEPWNYQHFYRHMLANIYAVSRANKTDLAPVAIILTGPVSKPGDLNEQLASRQYFLGTRSVMGAASKLYTSGTPPVVKSGATNRRRAGNVRRFVNLVDQLWLTWDLAAMEPAEIIDMLPPEFDDFRA